MYKLSINERAYLKKIVMYTRKEYLNKNKYIYIEENIDTIDEKFLVSIENVEINFEIKSDMDISSTQMEKVFSDEKISRIVETLTLREKLVLFLYYFEGKTDAAIGKALNIKGDTARKIRVRTIEKIKKQYQIKKGMNENV